MTVAPLLILAVGNPSRGDDALGPRLLERLADEPKVVAGDIELLTDFQLQIEHALDLVGRQGVIFVDAQVGLQEPFRFSQLLPAPDPSPHSHALSPRAVLATYAQLYGAPPPAWLLAIRGEHFELGAGLSQASDQALADAHHWLAERLRQGNLAE